MPGLHELFDLASIGVKYAVTLFLPRLILAAILGGLIGLERESKRKPAGLRTNMFIGFGAAMFTILSDQLQGGHPTGDHTRIAAQIIPGIGFIGAGSILHARGYVSGLTTAATLFVVASVGMAAGGGLYITATFSTLVVLLALYLLGQLESRFNLKLLTHSYEVTGQNPEQMQAEVTTILEPLHRLMQNIRVAKAHTHYRLQFAMEGTHAEQSRLLHDLKLSKLFESVNMVGPSELEPE